MDTTTLNMIIDFEEIDGAETVELEEAVRILNGQILVHQSSSILHLTPDYIAAKENLIERIEHELCRRRSADGMSPDQP